MIERLASSLYSRAPSRQEQIDLCLNSAELAASQSPERLHVKVPRWRIGDSTQSLPIIKNLTGSNSAGSIALAPIHSFAEVVREHFRATATRDVLVAGGLSRCEWLCRYIEQVADIRMVTDPPIQAAEGAALMALTACNEFRD